MSFRAFENPDDDQAGIWNKEFFRFFSEYAAKVNGEMMAKHGTVFHGM